MPEVGGVVGRDAARVHEHVVGRLEGDDGAARRVVEAHRRQAAPGRPIGRGPARLTLIRGRHRQSPATSTVTDAAAEAPASEASPRLRPWDRA